MKIKFECFSWHLFDFRAEIELNIEHSLHAEELIVVEGNIIFYLLENQGNSCRNPTNTQLL